MPVKSLFVSPLMNVVYHREKFESFKSDGHSSKKNRTISELKDIFYTDGRRSENIYISGKAGIGKSAFCEHLVNLWVAAHSASAPGHSTQDLRTMLQFSLLFFVKLSNVQVDEIFLNTDEIAFLIHDQLKLSNHCSMSAIQYCLRDTSTLVVFDGLDEMSSKRIPRRGLHNKCTVLVTFRPWAPAVRRAQLEGMIDKQIEITGLSKDSIEELTGKVITLLNSEMLQSKNVEDFKETIEKKSLQRLLNIPSILLVMLSLWYNGVPLGNNLYEVTMTLVHRQLLVAAKSNKLQHFQCHSVKEFPIDCNIVMCPCKTYSELLWRLAKLAFHTMFCRERENALVFEQEQTDIVGLSAEEVHFCLKAGLLTKNKPSGRLTTERKLVNFSHRAIQEWFTSIYLCRCIQVSDLHHIYADIVDINKALELDELLLLSCNGLETEIVGPMEKGATLFQVQGKEMSPELDGIKLGLTNVEYALKNVEQDLESTKIFNITERTTHTSNGENSSTEQKVQESSLHHENIFGKDATNFLTIKQELYDQHLQLLRIVLQLNANNSQENIHRCVPLEKKVDKLFIGQDPKAFLQIGSTTPPRVLDKNTMKLTHLEEIEDTPTIWNKKGHFWIYDIHPRPQESIVMPLWEEGSSTEPGTEHEEEIKENEAAAEGMVQQEVQPRNITPTELSRRLPDSRQHQSECHPQELTLGTTALPDCTDFTPPFSNLDIDRGNISKTRPEHRQSGTQWSRYNEITFENRTRQKFPHTLGPTILPDCTYLTPLSNRNIDRGNISETRPGHRQSETPQSRYNENEARQIYPQTSGATALPDCTDLTSFSNRDIDRGNVSETGPGHRQSETPQSRFNENEARQIYPPRSIREDTDSAEPGSSGNALLCPVNIQIALPYGHGTSQLTGSGIVELRQEGKEVEVSEDLSSEQPGSCDQTSIAMKTTEQDVVMDSLSQCLARLDDPACDGRIRQLDAAPISKFVEDKKPFASGAFGDTFLDKQLVIKRIHCRENVDNRESAINEMLASRLKHFAIVPLLAMARDFENKDIFFVTPYMEAGNLEDAIKRDNKLLQTKNSIKLTPEIRVRILFQIASCLAYLHKAVPGFRKPYIHGDIATRNIVLDGNYNARLLDFGLSNEIKGYKKGTTPKKSNKTGSAGYGQVSNKSDATIKLDCYSFGIVILQLLTGLPPEQCGKNSNERKRVRQKQRITIHSIWGEFGEEREQTLSPTLYGLAKKCLEEDEWKRITAAEIVQQLQDMKQLQQHQVLKKKPNEDTGKFHAALNYYFKDIQEHQGWQNKPYEDTWKCVMCMTNHKVKSNITDHGCAIAVCVPCLRNSHLNPLKCPSCNADVKSPVGCHWGAVLVAGNDVDDPVTAIAYSADLRKVYDVVTSKRQLAIGMSANNVILVRPENPGKDCQLLENLEAALQQFQQKTDVEVMLIYMIGYHNGQGFKLGGNQEFLTDEKLMKFLTQLQSGRNERPIRKFVLCFDCCSPIESFEEILNKSDFLGETKFIRLTSCSSNQRPPTNFWSGSIFTTLFVQCLKGEAGKANCFTKPRSLCSICADSHLSGKYADGFISLEFLAEYIERHIEEHIRITSFQQKCTSNTKKIRWPDTKIAYWRPSLPDFEFFHEYGDTNFVQCLPVLPETVHLLKREMKQTVRDKLGEYDLKAKYFKEICAVTVKSGPKDQDMIELDTIERIESAWNGHCRMHVSCRSLYHIQQGKVGIFLENRELLECLQSMESDCIRKEDRNQVKITTKFLMSLYDTLLANESYAEKLQQLIDIFEKLLDLDGLEEEGKNLVITFPTKDAGSDELEEGFFMMHVELDEETSVTTPRVDS